MKIVLVTEFYYPHTGGITEHVHHLGRELARKGHHVTILTNHVAEAPRRAAREEVEGMTVVRIGTGVPVESNGSQSRITVGRNLDGQVRELLVGVDLVHVHSPLFPMLPYVALKLGRKLGIPTVGTFHTHFSNNKAWRFFRGMISGYAKALDCCIAVSESARRSVADLVDRPFVLIPNGVDVSAWSSGKPRPELADMRNLVFLGRLDPRNDVEILIAAFVELAQQRDDVRLVLVGDGARRSASEAAVPAALRGRVVFVRAQAGLQTRADFMASADVAAFTARICSHPQTLIEAMSSARPVVAYDIEGVRELVTSGGEGYLAPLAEGATAAAGLAAAFSQVLSLDDKTRHAMGQRALSRVAEFDWPRVAARIEAVYTSLIAGTLSNTIPA